MQKHPLDTWRRAAGLTLEQLAEKIGTSQPTLSKVFSGKLPALSKKVAFAAHALCGGAVSLQVLMLGSGYPKRGKVRKTA